MNRAQSWVPGALLLCLTLFPAAPARGATQCEIDAAELDRQRLIGGAHYENDDYRAAAAAFERAVELVPDSADDRFNLGLCLMRGAEYDRTLSVLEQVEELDPEHLAMHYVRGIVLKNQGRYTEAVQSLTGVVERDPRCFGAYYNLGICFKKLDDTAAARQAFEAAIRLDSEHPSAHYQMITVAREAGDVELAKRHAEIFDRVKDTIDESEKTAEALERSAYSELIRIPRLGTDLEPALAAAVRFVDQSEQAGIASTAAAPPSEGPIRFLASDYDADDARRAWLPTVGGAVRLGDVDRDGDLDILVVKCAATSAASSDRLYLNDSRGRFTDATSRFGLDDDRRGLDAVFGDYDNDGHDDLYVVNDGPNRLYRKQGDGAYEGDGTGTSGPAVVALRERLPRAFTIEVEVETLDIPEGDWNGFVIFDYRGPADFKFAGARIGEGYWTIGQYDGAWNDLARLEDGITTGRVYPLLLRVEGGTVALFPHGEGGEKRLAHDFGGPLNEAKVGLAVDGASARFDNVWIRADPDAAPQEAIDGTDGVVYAENFTDGRPDGFEVLGGSWEVVDWSFEEVSEQARVNEPQLGRKAILFDYDHDNDLDIFVANGAELAEPPERAEFVVPDDFPGQTNTLLRNNGNGTFGDRTDEAGLLVDLSRSTDVLFGDWDGDNDIDLFVANEDAPSLLFANLRLGRFGRGGALEPPVNGVARAAAQGDFDHDGRIDLIVAIDDRLRLYGNTGQGDFESRPIAIAEPLSRGGVGEIEVLDYNNDGWSDLLLVATEERAVRLLAGNGPAAFSDVTARVGLDKDFGRVADLAVGDLDGDGDEDIVLETREAGTRLLVNQGGNRRHWLDVRTHGKKVNSGGYGAYVEISSGGHYQKKLVQDGSVHFGLGDLAAVEVVRVTWPNGVAQNVIVPAIDAELNVHEHVKVSASCGFLWAYDGRGFELINEVLGVGALGAPIAPGQYHRPDSTELLTIEAHQLQARNGSYELRLSEELREIMYLDRTALRVVDHPADLEIVPNEMFTAPPFPEDRLFGVGDARPPRSAIDDRGRDVTDLVSRRDGRFPSFDLVPRYDGLAESHSLTLDLGDLTGAEQVVLFLDGWIYWPEASTVIALAQDPRHGIEPLAIEVRDAGSRWRTVIDSVGLPTSKGLIVPVDLTGRFPAGQHHVRLTTNMRIYFDRIFLSTRDSAARSRVTELPVAASDLHYRGFSALRRDRYGYERFDYDDVLPTGSWSPPRGLFTRYGDVRPLLASVDDMFVIIGPGDELRLQFEARRLPRLPAGWIRDFVFYAEGWVKDGDLNTKFSETVEPLPFHGMSGYPYPPTERYPDTPERRAYRERYNTRPGVPTVGRLSAASLAQPASCGRPDR